MRVMKLVMTFSWWLVCCRSVWDRGNSVCASLRCAAVPPGTEARKISGGFDQVELAPRAGRAAAGAAGDLAVLDADHAVAVLERAVVVRDDQDRAPRVLGDLGEQGHHGLAV